MDTPATVFIVDDDLGMRNSLVRLFRMAGYPAVALATAHDFVSRLPVPGEACVILDLRMPGMGGLEVLDLLRARGDTLPVILYTGHADVSVAVRAMKAGAFDVIEKPFSDDFLVERVRQALDQERRLRRHRQLSQAARAGVARLTEREQQVAALLAEGLTAAQAGRRLQIGARTVETHRVRIFEKLGIGSAAELARLMYAASLGPGAT